jgi:hypothetical protein
LGTATSGVTFFRTVGGAFGTAVFGAVFSNLLASNVAAALPPNAVPANLPTLLSTVGPSSLAQLPSATYQAVVSGIVQTIQTVFLIAVPIAALAFALSWLLPEIELRTTVRAADAEQGTAKPELGVGTGGMRAR